MKKKEMGSVSERSLEYNLRLAKVLQISGSFLEKNGYRFLPLSMVNYSERMVINNNFSVIRDLCKVVNGDGQVLALPNDLLPLLLYQAEQGNDFSRRFFTYGDTYSFLQQEQAHTTELVAVSVGMYGFEPEAEMIAIAQDLVHEFGINCSVRIGNTEITQGVLDEYAQSSQPRERVKRVLQGKVENDVDLATNQAYAVMKQCVYDDPGLTLKTTAEKIDNKRAMDGLLNIFDIMNVLTLQGRKMIRLDPFYIGTKEYENGVVFAVDDKKIPIEGGRCNFLLGNDVIPAVYLRLNVEPILDYVSSARKSNVLILIADSMIAHESALMMRKQFQSNGYSVENIYQCTKETVSRVLARRNVNTMVVYIDEEGNVNP